MKKHHPASMQDLINFTKVGSTRRHGGAWPSLEDERGGAQGCGLEDSHS